MRKRKETKEEKTQVVEKKDVREVNREWKRDGERWHTVWNRYDLSMESRKDREGTEHGP